MEGERCLQGTGLGWALWRAWLELCLGGWVRLEQARERKEDFPVGTAAGGEVRKMFAEHWWFSLAGAWGVCGGEYEVISEG